MTSSTWKHKGETIRQQNMIPTQRIDRLGGLNTTFHFETTVSRIFNYAVERNKSIKEKAPKGMENSTLEKVGNIFGKKTIEGR
jgi:hypothetical protein